MADAYVHGIVIQESTGEIRAVTSPSQSIVGIVGTADGVSTLKDNEPKAFLTKKEALAALRPDDTTQSPGSLHYAVLGVHEQTEDTIILVKAKSDSDADIQTGIEALLDAESITGYKPKVIIATKTDAAKQGPAIPVSPTNSAEGTNLSNPVNPTEGSNPGATETPRVEGSQPSATRSRTVNSRTNEVKNS